MKQVIISPETIMELMAEKGFMPEEVYQDLLKQEDCQKHRKILAFITILILEITEKWEVKPSLNTVLISSATFYIRLMEIIAE
jgi:hypothetical protein